MKIPQPPILAGVVLFFLILGAGIVIKPGLYEYDSYYYLDLICHGDKGYNKGALPLETAFFEMLPCNELPLKFLMLGLFGLTFMAICLIAKLYDSPLIVAYFFLSPALILASFRLENDIFAIPIIFAGLFFILKHKKENIATDAWIGIFLIGISCFIWGAAIIPFLSLALLFWWFMPFAIITIGVFFEKLEGGILPNLAVNENFFVYGLQFAIIYFLVFSQDFKKIRIEHAFWAVPLAIFGILNPKFFIFAIPGLALAANKTIQEFSIEEQLVTKWFALIVMIFLAITFSFFQTAPSITDHKAVKDSITWAQKIGKPISNDFEYGHLIHYYGGETAYYAGYGGKINDANSIVLSKQTFNCPKINVYENNFWGNNLILYDC